MTNLEKPEEEELNRMAVLRELRRMEPDVEWLESENSLHQHTLKTCWMVLFRKEAVQ